MHSSTETKGNSPFNLLHWAYDTGSYAYVGHPRIDIGDRVTVTELPKTSPSIPTLLFDSSLCGQHGTIAGFPDLFVSRYKVLLQGVCPGKYWNRAVALVNMDDGRQIPLSVLNLLPDSPRASISGFDDLIERISDLPDTDFWEGDTVLINGLEKIVGAIDYSAMDDTDPRAAAIYLCSDFRFAGNAAKLKARGKVWNFHHGCSVTFDNHDEEREFHIRVNNITLVEVDDAAHPDHIVSGKADWLIRLVTTSRFVLVKFKDPIIGDRAAQRLLPRNIDAASRARASQP